MRVVLILVVLVTAVCLAVIGFVGDRERPPTKDKQTAYKAEFPYDLLGKMASYWPFATFKLSSRPIAAVPAVPTHYQIPASQDTRVIRLAIVSGQAARISYTCDASDCPRITCVVAKGSSSPPDCGGEPVDSRSFALERSGGNIKIEALLNQPVQLESR